MREHAVPQNVTSYEFHLIGNMTLKQFLELAAGIVLAFVIYKTNLPDLIKIPIAIIVAGVGAMIAFVPFEGRPLDQWFIAFVKSIYKPTEYYWRKTSHVPDYFTYTPLQSTKSVDEVDLAPYRKQRIMEFIDTLPAPNKLELINLEEAQKINNLTALFDEVEVHHDTVSATPLEPEKPSVVPETHVLKPLDKLQTQPEDVPTAELNQQTAFSDTQVLPSEDINSTQIPATDNGGVNIPSAVVPEVTNNQVPSDPIDLMALSSITETVDKPLETTSQTEVATKKEVTIPDTGTVQVEKTQQPPELTLSEQQPVNNPIDIYSAELMATAQQPTDVQPATTSTSLPFPKKPTVPNVVTGMVFDPQGKIVDNAIVEITDMNGLPVRAVKTNTIGQFFVTTPLKDGSYVVNTEKEGYQFPSMSFDLQNTLLDPLTITANIS